MKDIIPTSIDELLTEIIILEARVGSAHQNIDNRFFCNELLGFALLNPTYELRAFPSRTLYAMPEINLDTVH